MTNEAASGETVTPNEEATAAPAPAGKPSWGWRIGVFALGGALLAVLIAILALTLARYGVIEKLTGFSWYVKSNSIGAASALIGLLALIIALVRKTAGRLSGVTAIVIGLAMFGIFYSSVLQPARGNPFLHDVSTDVADPPAFETLTLREDNLDQFDGDIEQWRSAHREGYPDIQPIIIDKSPELALADVAALAEERGWEIANKDTANGRLEAVATAGYIQFLDDVVVEVTPIADGSSRVDMRSVSRVGMTDLGYNAERIRAFLSDLGAR